MNEQKNELYNPQAESAILALLIKNPDLLDRVPYLSPKMFTSIPNKNIFDSIRIIRKEGLVPDYSLLVTYLSSKNLLKLFGGENYLQWLMAIETDEGNFDVYADNIVNGFKIKELINISANLSNMVKGGESSDYAISWLNNKVNELNLNAVSDVIDINSASSEMFKQLVERLNGSTDIPEVSTGFSDLDLITGGYFPGEVWFIASRPSMGKSATMCNSVLSGVPSMVFSLEMPVNSITQRMVAIKSNVSPFNMRLGNIDKKGIDKIEEAIATIKNLPIYINTSYLITPTSISSYIRQYVREKGIRVVHIDYIQLLAERGENSVHELGRISRDMKLLANELGITIVLYSQLNRLVEGREDKRPILSDIRQSGNLEEDGDIVIFLYRDIVYNPETKNKNEIEFIIRKQRNGPIGTIFGEFIGETNLIKFKERS